MARFRRRRSAVGRASLVAAIVVIPTLAIGAATWSVTRIASTERMNLETYCYAQEGQSHTAFMLDASFGSVTSERQQRDLRNALIGAFDALTPNEQISVFTTAKGDIGTILVPVITFCRPARTTEEQARIPAPEQTPAYLKRHHDGARRAFIRQVDTLMAKAANPDLHADHSPIMEQVQSLSRHRFDGRLRKFFLYTDGLQNSAVRRFCLEKGHLPSFRKFSGQPDYELVRPDSLAGVEVEILLVEHTLYPAGEFKFCTNDEIRAFWTAYFEGAEAASVRQMRLPYGGLVRS